jgi:hypothetical protein
MTIRSNARVAGATFLVYIAAGMTGLIYKPGPLLEVGLWFVQCFSALVLAVTLHAITRGQDPDIAMLGLTFRVGEGILGAMYISLNHRLLSLAAVNSADSAGGAERVLNAFIHGAGRSHVLVCATFFAAGSTCFSWLLLRGRMIPVGLAWVGLAASVLLVVTLPLQFAEVLSGPVTMYIWLPMLAFEVPFGLWLLVRDPRVPARAT